MKEARHTSRGRPRVRRSTALLVGAALVAALVTFAQVSSAGVGRRGALNGRPYYPALVEAARIPNDQGPAPECAGTPTTAKPTTPAATPAPSTAPPAEPTVDPADVPADPTAEPPVDPTAEPAGGAVELAAANSAQDLASPQRRHANMPAWCHADQGGPAATDFVDIRQVAPTAQTPQRNQDASTGVFVSECGRNENGHFNSDNFIVAPGVTNGAHHTHDYVGNLSANGLSTNESLAAAGTTCRRNDQSVFFWPVLRQRGTQGPDQNADGGGNDGNVGRIIRPSSVRLEFRGNDRSQVVSMPRFIRVITGDAKATTNGPANARAQWTCTGFSNRLTTKYPLCPRGSQVQRILVFPSCWDGINVDSANHRAHIVFPDQTGACPAGTKAVPQLRMVLTYSVPSGRSFSLDSFPEQKHNPLTDHGDFANLMPDALMTSAVDCINRGRRC